MDHHEDSGSIRVSSGKVIGDKFLLEEKIGQGSFGMIFKCINRETQEPNAIKLEKRNQRHSSMLVREIKVMMEVKNEKGFARLSGYGKEENYNYVAMSFLGRNLDSLLRKCQGKFKLEGLLNVFEQTLQRVETLHSKKLIHRDIKPENFVIGQGSNYGTINLIDFGLAKYYIDSEGGHIPFYEKKGMIGTARYASVNAHLGYEQSRRDDLEGLGYIILYFAKGSLPWQSIQAESKEEKYEKIKQMKITISLEQLCKGLPLEFQQYFQHVKHLDFHQTPNYQFLYSLINKIRVENNIDPASQYVDWADLPEFRQRRKFQTYTPQQIQQQKKKFEDKQLGIVPQEGYQRISESQGVNNQKKSLVPVQIQRKTQQHLTNYLQIPARPDGTLNLVPSLSNLTANTSKVNNFQPSHNIQDWDNSNNNTNNELNQLGVKGNQVKISSFGDIDKQEINIKEKQKQIQQKYNKAPSNPKISIEGSSQKGQNNQINIINEYPLHEQQTQEIPINQNNEDSAQKPKVSKREEFLQNSENMGTTTMDYHKQYPINVMDVKKSYKNGQLP